MPGGKTIALTPSEVRALAVLVEDGIERITDRLLYDDEADYTDDDRARMYARSLWGECLLALLH